MNARGTAQRARLSVLLRRRGLVPAGGCALVQWVPTANAPALHEAFAPRGILTCLFGTPRSLRFGLPGRQESRQRLEIVLAASTKRDI